MVIGLACRASLRASVGQRTGEASMLELCLQRRLSPAALARRKRNASATAADAEQRMGNSSEHSPAWQSNSVMKRATRPLALAAAQLGAGLTDFALTRVGQQSPNTIMNILGHVELFGRSRKDRMSPVRPTIS